MINQCTCGGLSGRGPKWCDYCVSRMEKHSVAMEWQPIETAPKDGSYILLGNPEWETCWQGFWDSAQSEKYPTPFRTGYEGWQRFNSSGQDLLSPTHWQPLPEPPQ